MFKKNSFIIKQKKSKLSNDKKLNSINLNKGRRLSSNVNMDEKLKVSLETFKIFQMNQLKKKKSQYKKQANYSERKTDILEEKDEYEDKKSKNTKRGEDSPNSKISNSSNSLLQKMTLRTKSPKTKSNKCKNIINEDNNTLLDKKDVKKVV